jgi:hypothetical protein
MILSEDGEIFRLPKSVWNQYKSVCRHYKNQMLSYIAQETSKLTPIVDGLSNFFVKLKGGDDSASSPRQLLVSLRELGLEMEHTDFFRPTRISKSEPRIQNILDPRASKFDLNAKNSSVMRGWKVESYIEYRGGYGITQGLYWNVVLTHFHPWLRKEFVFHHEQKLVNDDYRLDCLQDTEVLRLSNLENFDPTTPIFSFSTDSIEFKCCRRPYFIVYLQSSKQYALVGGYERYYRLYDGDSYVPLEDLIRQSGMKNIYPLNENVVHAVEEAKEHLTQHLSTAENRLRSIISDFKDISNS